jgi:hypothetical protein
MREERVKGRAELLSPAARAEAVDDDLCVVGAVAVELCAIAWVRKRYLRVSLSGSLVEVTAGGAGVAVVGVLVAGVALREPGCPLLTSSVGRKAIFCCPWPDSWGRRAFS